MNKSIISWDFDWTLYDPEKNCLIPQTYKIWKDIQEKGEYNQIITTYRSRRDLKDIERLLGRNTFIIATNGEDKVGTLLSYPIGQRVITHFDDDYSVCCDCLKYSKIKPVYIDWKGHAINDMDTVDLSYYAMTR